MLLIFEQFTNKHEKIVTFYYSFISKDIHNYCLTKVAPIELARSVFPFFFFFYFFGQ